MKAQLSKSSDKDCETYWCGKLSVLVSSSLSLYLVSSSQRSV